MPSTSCLIRVLSDDLGGLGRELLRVVERLPGGSWIPVTMAARVRRVSLIGGVMWAIRSSIMATRLAAADGDQPGQDALAPDSVIELVFALDDLDIGGLAADPGRLDLELVQSGDHVFDQLLGIDRDLIPGLVLDPLPKFSNSAGSLVQRLSSGNLLLAYIHRPGGRAFFAECVLHLLLKAVHELLVALIGR